MWSCEAQRFSSPPCRKQAGGPGPTVTPSVCQGLQPNGLALESLISLHPGCITGNLRTDEKPSLPPCLPDLPQSYLKHTTANLPCLGTHGAASTHILCSPCPPPTSNSCDFGAQRILDRKSQGCRFENSVGWPGRVLSERHAQKTSLWAAGPLRGRLQVSEDSVHS